MKLIAKQRIPDLNDIYTRMNARMGEQPFVVRSIIRACAEEAERILLEHRRGHEERTMVVYQKSHQVGAKHYCSDCASQKIYSSHEFCPHCGVKIKWIRIQQPMSEVQ